jgi:hypothetical protein
MGGTKGVNRLLSDCQMCLLFGQQNFNDGLQKVKCLLTATSRSPTCKLTVAVTTSQIPCFLSAFDTYLVDMRGFFWWREQKKVKAKEKEIRLLIL